MSLDALRRTRLSGHRPKAALVIVGPSIPLDDGPETVVVDRRGMDLRPLLGVPVFVLQTGPDSALMLRTLDDLEALQAPLLGGATADGFMGVTEEHAEFAWRTRRALCEKV